MKEGEGKVHGYLHTCYSRRREPIGLQRGSETDRGGGDDRWDYYITYIHAILYSWG